MAKATYGGYGYECERCHCALDPSEGRICDECERELEKERRYAKRWCLTMQQVRELKQEGLVLQ